ncbi:very short patch repair endonuclease [Sporomusa paucivorans]|uniref:very short patch repair endonuclease n=1 Tax=Sporomusa paucivorans TaxID=2376 RepID=UPI003571523C
MDIWSREKRSEVMAKIKSKDTKPEKAVRSLLHRMGYRFRIHRKDLPGRPDIILPKYRAVIFVHGCFWHLHEGCRDGTVPKTGTGKWREKLENNVARDKRNIGQLEELGWRVLTLWECEIEKKPEKIRQRLEAFINEGRDCSKGGNSET